MHTINHNTMKPNATQRDATPHTTTQCNACMPAHRYHKHLRDLVAQKHISPQMLVHLLASYNYRSGSTDNKRTNKAAEAVADFNEILIKVTY